jgi:integrase
LLLALWTGQRQGDLLRLPWSAHDGTHIRLRQSKSMRRGGHRPVYVTVPVGAPLKVALNEAAKSKHSPIILLNSEGRPWTQDGFRASWGKACKRAKIEEVTFNDLRGTAVTRLALVGCTEAEIATITGHSLRDVRSILDAHYLHRDRALAESAIGKLETGYAQRLAEAKTEQFLQNDRQNDRPSPAAKGGKSERKQLAGELGFEPRFSESESSHLH